MADIKEFIVRLRCHINKEFFHALYERLKDRLPFKGIGKWREGRRKKDALTIMLLPSDSSRARQFKIPLSVYRTLKFAAVPLVFLFLYTLVDYGNMLVKAGDIYRLKRENISQRVELEMLSTKIGELEANFSKLRIFDKKLRMIANIEEPNYSKDALGMGGVPSRDDYLLQVEDKREELLERMHSSLKQLENEAGLQEKSFAEIEEFLYKQSTLLASTPSIWPLKGWLTSIYGMRRDPFTGYYQMHKGLDIANRPGAPVFAPGDGTVIKVSINPYLGKFVEISHGYGIKTIYGHLSEMYVRSGQRVKRGDKVAGVGNTGKSTGSHLHYEVLVNGLSVDPKRYILN